MPILHKPSQAPGPRVEFAVSVPLDLLNCMSFTSLAGDSDGLPEWNVETRRRMDPALRDELDFFMKWPGTDWGLLGALEDVLFLHREAWSSVEALLDFVRDMPVEAADPMTATSSLRGLFIYSTEHNCVDFEDPQIIADLRERVRSQAGQAGIDPAAAVVSLVRTAIERRALGAA